MLPSEKVTVLKAVAAVAWADGNFSEKEKNELKAIVNYIGLTDEEIEKVINQAPDVNEVREEMKAFDRKLVGELLQFCYRIGMSDDEAHDKEIDVIKSLASDFWPEKYIDNVLEWLGKNYETEKLFIQLFVIPEMIEKQKEE